MQLLPVFSPGERVLAAVSGGADSVCLLHALCGLRARGEIALCAAHFNHQIRDGAADGDEAFVRALCAALSVPLTVGRADVPALARVWHEGIETAARRARRAFLQETADRMDCGAIATGHHAGDQAETVLMHLLRGGGLRGAAGMRARAGRFARPLLATTKDELLAALRDMGQDYCRDATNEVPDVARNRIRLEAMPSMRLAYPGAEAALCRFAQIAADEDDFLDGAAGAFLRENAQDLAFGARLRVKDAHPAVLRRALRAFAGCAAFSEVERVAQLYRAARGALEMGGMRYERAGDFLYAIDKAAVPPRAVEAVDGAVLAGVGRLRVEACAAVVRRDNGLVQVVDARCLEGAQLRVRRPGDRMRVLGAPGERKLSDILIDAKVDRPLRDFLGVVARGNQVMWVPLLRLAREAAITEHTQGAVRLTWEREEL